MVFLVATLIGRIPKFYTGLHISLPVLIFSPFSPPSRSFHLIFFLFSFFHLVSLFLISFPIISPFLFVVILTGCRGESTSKSLGGWLFYSFCSLLLRITATVTLGYVWSPSAEQRQKKWRNTGWKVIEDMEMLLNIALLFVSVIKPT